MDPGPIQDADRERMANRLWRRGVVRDLPDGVTLVTETVCANTRLLHDIAVSLYGIVDAVDHQFTSVASAMGDARLASVFALAHNKTCVDRTIHDPLHAGEGVLLVDLHLTDPSPVLDTLHRLRARQAVVQHAAVLLERDGAVREPLAHVGCMLHALFTEQELAAYLRAHGPTPPPGGSSG